MDSGKSGSLQSSSGGDGDGGVGYVNPSSTHFNQIPILQSPSNFFNPSSFSQPPNPNPNPNSIYDLDSIWSRNPNSIYDLDIQKAPYRNPNPVDDNINPNPIKNPKKRTRASRRAPTTVLTTDTTNFRQMVQQFTGSPAAPYATSSSASYYSRRLDIHGGGITQVLPLRPSASYLNSVSTPTSSFQLPPSETHSLTKQPLNLTNLQNQMFPFHSISPSTLPLQVNVTERENQQSEHPDPFVGSSLKRWRGEGESLMNFEGRSGNNSQNVRNDGDQLPGNEDSWICPSD